MANYTASLKSDWLLKSHPVSGSLVRFTLPVASALSIASGDRIQICNIPAGYVVKALSLGHDATLGASCTLTGAIGTTAITAATTAGGASYIGQTGALIPVAPSTSAAVLNLLVSGAGITATANIVVDFIMIPAQTVTLPS